MVPDSSVNSGIIAKVWSGMRLANGFSGCSVSRSGEDVSSGYNKRGYLSYAR